MFHFQYINSYFNKKIIAGIGHLNTLTTSFLLGGVGWLSIGSNNFSFQPSPISVRCASCLSAAASEGPSWLAKPNENKRGYCN